MTSKPPTATLPRLTAGNGIAPLARADLMRARDAANYLASVMPVLRSEPYTLSTVTRDLLWYWLTTGRGLEKWVHVLRAAEGELAIARKEPIELFGERFATASGALLHQHGRLAFLFEGDAQPVVKIAGLLPEWSGDPGAAATSWRSFALAVGALLNPSEPRDDLPAEIERHIFRLEKQEEFRVLTGMIDVARVGAQLRTILDFDDRPLRRGIEREFVRAEKARTKEDRAILTRAPVPGREGDCPPAGAATSSTKVNPNPPTLRPAGRGTAYIGRIDSGDPDEPSGTRNRAIGTWRVYTFGPSFDDEPKPETLPVELRRPYEAAQFWLSRLLLLQTRIRADRSDPAWVASDLLTIHLELGERTLRPALDEAVALIDRLVPDRRRIHVGHKWPASSAAAIKGIVEWVEQLFREPQVGVVLDDVRAVMKRKDAKSGLFLNIVRDSLWGPRHYVPGCDTPIECRDFDPAVQAVLLDDEGKRLNAILDLVPRLHAELENVDVELLRVELIDEFRAAAASAKPAVVQSDTASDTAQILLTLNQAAALVHRSKRTLEKYKEEMPQPYAEGGGGKADYWAWPEMREWLQKKFKIALPEIPPNAPEWARSLQR